MVGNLAASQAVAANRLQAVNPPGVSSSPVYSHAIIAPAGGRTVYVSGQLGIDPEGRIVSGYTAQVKQAYANLAAVLAGAGARPEDVVKLTVLIVDHGEEKLAPLREASAALFGSHLPASTLHPVPRLAREGLLFEVEAIAVIPE